MVKRLTGLLLAAALLLALPVLSLADGPADRVHGRDDGTWLFPLDPAFWERISDWSGCPGNGVCGLCGRKHTAEKVGGRTVSWGDSFHTAQADLGHNGIDVAASRGTPVLSACSGRVAYTGAIGARGKTLIVEHPVGDSGWSYYAYYQHLDSYIASPGDVVEPGTVIATVGNTGGSATNPYGAHLHFGIVMAESWADIAGCLSAVERQGWLTWEGFAQGRVLNNPSVRQEGRPTTSDMGGAVLAPLAAHSGSVTYTFDPAQVRVPGDPEPEPEVQPGDGVRYVTCAVLADGEPLSFPACAIADDDGNDTFYLKLRDVACALNGTGAQFNVGWDGSAITVETGKAYADPTGAEMSDIPQEGAVCTGVSVPLVVNGQTVELDALLITAADGSGHTCFKLRDLGDLAGFAVGWTVQDGVTIRTTQEEP